MDRSWLGQWLNNRFGGSLQRTPARRRRKKSARLELEHLEDRTLFNVAIWTGAFNTSGGTAPPSPFPTTAPFPPQLNQHAGFAQPFWSIPQNWVNSYVPQNGDDVVFPSAATLPGVTLNKTILPLSNNAFQT